jgi:tRNA/tmRNA/rRNA uracil-C5-methylase (TrmA/RlmC/RlmD family)
VAHYIVGERTLEVSQKSFWQSHKDAPRILSEAAIEMADAKAGEDMLDLYGGVGLFTAAFIDLIGPTGRIDIVEGSKSATADARRNFADSPQVHIHTGDVAQILPRFARADLILLDPPREGAGKNVAQLCAQLSPTRILYIACDPAALARDTGYLQGFGYTLEKVRAFDLFPMTHHIEAIALFTPSKVS